MTKELKLISRVSAEAGSFWVGQVEEFIDTPGGLGGERRMFLTNGDYFWIYHPYTEGISVGDLVRITLVEEDSGLEFHVRKLSDMEVTDEG